MISIKLDRKIKTAVLSVISNSILITIKLIVGIYSGSVSIISEAMHSTIDLIASIIAAFSVKLSSKPADKEHPYGHGKIENISGLIEGLLILVAVFMIILEAVDKLSGHHELNVTAAAVGVMMISALINLIVSSILYKVAREEDSIALEADALHLKTDVLTSAGVGIGLILIKITGFSVIDPIAAILVALLILKEAWNLCLNAFNPLLDSSLPEKEEKIIEQILKKYTNNNLQFDHLKTRKSGPYRFVDFHVITDPDISVKKADEMTKHIIKEIENSIPNVHVHINIEPKKRIIGLSYSHLFCSFFIKVYNKGENFCHCTIHLRRYLLPNFKGA
ncbi:MAG TPA: cation transporter [Peptococcaceae bacterium]|nr:MAG: Cation diffusion facilitator family transporter [Clostridia bacterium 41_269]HBT20807.1 cation transporter [Peptococcaceae bacterium]